MGAIPVQVIGLGYTLAILAVGIPAAVLVLLGLTRMARRDAPPVREIERAAMLGAIGTVLMLATLTLFLAEQSWQLGMAFGVLSVVYVLYALPEATRRLTFRSAVTVRCRPEDAFEFVSDARNWPLYFPEMKAVEPVDVPPHVGSRIHLTVTLPTVSLSADERVTEYEPPKRFATAMEASKGDGVYDFTPVDGGTKIAYTVRMVIGIRHALLDHAVLRFSTVRAMRRRREQAMQVMKQILEARQPATV